MKCLTNKIRVLLVVILTTLSLVATAQERFALVIGNSAYEDTHFLPNTLNDAQLVADTLESLDFKVTHLQDLDYRGMINARRQFVKQLPSKSVALFYYAGHQVQSGGDHYLLPIGSIDGLEEEYLSEDAISLNRIIADLEDKSELRLLFLDACRDNPLPNADKASRGIKTTYKPIINGTGTIVSFASQSGKPAYDGDAGNNSIYTKTLVEQMLQPNVSIVDMLEEVKNQVTKATKNTQQPRDNKKEFSGSFCFKVEGDVAGCGITININQVIAVGPFLKGVDNIQLVELEDGSSYVGQIIGSNTPQGKGVMTLSNGNQIEGEWHNGDISKGKITTAEGSKYEGEIQNKQMHGQGVLASAEVGRYEGEFKNGLMDGQGEQLQGGNEYKGEFKDGIFIQGQVAYIDLDSTRYEGEWRDGQPHGQGVLTYADGERYEGEFKDGRPYPDQVSLSYANGMRYEGTVASCKLNGVLTFEDGEEWLYVDGKVWVNGKVIQDVCQLVADNDW